MTCFSIRWPYLSRRKQKVIFSIRKFEIQAFFHQPGDTTLALSHVPKTSFSQNPHGFPTSFSGCAVNKWRPILYLMALQCTMNISRVGNRKFVFAWLKAENSLSMRLVSVQYCANKSCTFRIINTTAALLRLLLLAGVNLRFILKYNNYSYSSTYTLKQQMPLGLSRFDLLCHLASKLNFESDV